jgi:hypothetical protein
VYHRIDATIMTAFDSNVAACTPPAEETENTRLVQDSSVDGTIVQVLNGQSYALNPKRLDPPPLSTAGVLLQGTITATTLVLSPILFVGAAVLTIPMFIKPIQHCIVAWLIPC